MEALMVSAAAVLLLLMLTAVALVAIDLAARIDRRERAAALIRQLEHLLARTPARH